MTIGKKIASGFGVALLSLALIGGLAYWSTDNLLASNDKVVHTYKVIENLDTLLLMMLNRETGQRGYLMTEDLEFKKPFTDATPLVPQLLASIAKATRDNDEQQKRVQELERRLKARMAYTDETIRVAETGEKEKSFGAARDIVKQKRGKQLMDDVRDTIKDMVEAEKKLLETRQTAAQRNSSLVLATIGIGGVGACIAMVVIGTMTVMAINASLRDGVNRLAAASAEILAGSTQQAAGAQEQAAAVTQTMTTIDEVTQTADQSAQRAKLIDDAVQRNLDVGKTGRKIVDDSLVAMEAVKEQTESTAENILRLAEQAQAIGEIIATVNELAEQSNLLALNAGIEASRAGEHGRGFTVVAGEVKALADQSKKATAQVRQILGDIQKSTNSAVLSTEAVTKGVASAIKVGSQAGQTIKTLGDTLTETAQGIKQIAASVAQQATGMTQINQAMRNIDQVAKQNAVATRQAAVAAEDLNKLGTQLSTLIGS